MSLQDLFSSSARPVPMRTEVPRVVPATGGDYSLEFAGLCNVSDLSAVLEEFPECIEGFHALATAMKMEHTAKHTGPIRAPFWAFSGGKYDRAVPNHIMRVLAAQDIDPALLDKEMAEYPKFGMFYAADAQTLLPGTKAYFERKPEIPHATVLELRAIAIQLANEMRRLAPPVLLSSDRCFSLIKKDTYFGAPYFTSKWDESQAILESMARFASQCDFLDRDAVIAKLRLPSVMFSRVVPNGDKSKARRTFAASKYDALLSKRITYPLIDAFKQGNTRTTEYGIFYQGHQKLEHVHAEMREFGYQLSLDYSAFDQCVRTQARDIVKAYMMEYYADIPECMFAVEALFSAMEGRSFLSPYGYLTPIGTVGLESGVGVTGVVGTIWNACIQQLMLRRLGIRDYRSFAYGDDALLCTNERIPVTVASAIAAECGMVVHHDKQDEGTRENPRLIFLQKVTTKRHISAHSIIRMLPRLMYGDVTTGGDEKAPVEGNHPWRDKCGETLSSLEELKNHPQFRWFVRFVVDHHPIHMCPAAYIDFAKMRLRVAQGDNVARGIETWECVKEIALYWQERGLDPTTFVSFDTEVYYKAKKAARKAFSIGRKGFPVTVGSSILLSCYSGEKHRYTEEETGRQNYFNTHGNRKVMDVVLRWQKANGVQADAHDVLMLRRGVQPKLALRSSIVKTYKETGYTPYDVSSVRVSVEEYPLNDSEEDLYISLCETFSHDGLTSWDVGPNDIDGEDTAVHVEDDFYQF